MDRKKTVRPCGNPECACSTGICETTTYGSGELDNNGYWEHPCGVCARHFEDRFGDNWPSPTFGEFFQKLVDIMFVRYGWAGFTSTAIFTSAGVPLLNLIFKCHLESHSVNRTASLIHETYLGNLLPPQNYKPPAGQAEGREPAEVAKPPEAGEP